VPGILIVAHTPIAGSMLGFVEHTYGKAPIRMAAIDIPPHEDTKISFDRVYEAATKVQSEHGILVLTDVMGATPANVATRLAKSGLFQCKVIVLAGVNLPMLMRAISYRGTGVESVALKAMQGAQNGIIRLGGHTTFQEAETILKDNLRIGDAPD
jgi:PTS system ascorbate-specific IIA component